MALDSSDEPDHLIQPVADEDRGLLVEVGDAEPAGCIGTEYRDSIAPAPSVRGPENAGHEVRPDGSPQPGEAALTGS